MLDMQAERGVGRVAEALRWHGVRSLLMLVVAVNDALLLQA